MKPFTITDLCNALISAGYDRRADAPASGRHGHDRDIHPPTRIFWTDPDETMTIVTADGTEVRAGQDDDVWLVDGQPVDTVAEALALLAGGATVHGADSLIGREVVRLSTRAGKPYWSHGDRGAVVEETDERIRIKWKERRTWLARNAEGTRWAIADSEQGRAAIAWAAEELERDRARRASLPVMGGAR